MFWEGRAKGDDKGRGIQQRREAWNSGWVIGSVLEVSSAGIQEKWIGGWVCWSQAECKNPGKVGGCLDGWVGGWVGGPALGASNAGILDWNSGWVSGSVLGE